MLLALVSLTAQAADPFEQPVAIGGYALGWQGSYGAAGLGGNLRLEPFEHLGVDLFAEHLMVETPSGYRHDHPIGFDAYVPVRVSQTVRLRPLLGTCAVGSFLISTDPEAPGASDVLFGLHAGLGAELALADQLSAFAIGKAVGWMGHDRAVAGWSGQVGNELVPFAVGQIDLGVSLHFGRSSS